MDAYYAILHMQEFKRDHERLVVPSDAHKWGKDLANTSDTNLRSEFYRIQQMLASVICKDVCRTDGMFYGSAPSRQEVAVLLELQGDTRPFNAIGGYLPFPARSKSRA
jgi:hypothetical protein